MTLAEVAARAKAYAENRRLSGMPFSAEGADWARSAFEADEDFALGQRIRDRLARLRAMQKDPDRNPGWDQLRECAITELEALLSPPEKGRI